VQHPTLSDITRHRRPGWLIFAALCLTTWTSRAWAIDPETLASHEDAYVKHDATTNEWLIGSRGLELVVGFNDGSTLELRRVWNPQSGRISDVSGSPDVSVTLGGDELPLRKIGDRVYFLRASAEETSAGVRLSLTFEDRTLHAIVTRLYAAYPRTPTIETWTRVDVPASVPPVQVSGMVGWQLAMGSASVRWVNGLRGSNSDRINDDAFAIHAGELEDGEHVEIKSDRRSTELFVPLLFVDGSEDTFYGGAIWSGAWRITVDRMGDQLAVKADFPAYVSTASPGTPLEFPHTFFGVTQRSAVTESAALYQFILGGIRQGRPFQPMVTYNTWFPYGVRISEGVLTEEITRAAELGVELFVVDAGWYQGAGANGQYDFTSGLGSWTVDPDRFPSELNGFSDQAHALGMKFGLWIEPERVALGTVGLEGLAQEEWLGTQDGSYGDSRSAQVCLASAGRQWVFDRIVALVDRVKPDYLKWDNNFWLNCNRSDHDHGPEDGNFAHVVALYGMLAELRQRYPNLLIENVSGGGNRLDYGMLAYTDTAWMDDGTAPSTHVRRNLEGLSLGFPPAYLLSFVINSPVEPLSAGNDFPAIARSRMPGILGVSYRSRDIDSQLSDALSLGIAQYKLVRGIISQAYALLLGGQASVNEQGWDVVQEVSEDQRTAVIFAFKGTADPGTLLVQPLNLLPDAIYRVTSVDTGDIGALPGSQLMQDGIQIVQSDGSRAHIILLDASAGASGAARPRPLPPLPSFPTAPLPDGATVNPPSAPSSRTGPTSR
jgi:alpha-galactosidase